MENKYLLNQILTNRQNGKVMKIYATSNGQPFDLLDVSILVHYEVVTVQQLQQKMKNANIVFELVAQGRSIALTLNSKEDAERYIETIAPLFNKVLVS